MPKTRFERLFHWTLVAGMTLFAAIGAARVWDSVPMGVIVAAVAILLGYIVDKHGC